MGRVVNRSIVLLLATVACESSAPRTDAATTPGESASVRAPAARPAVKRAPLSIEGTTDTIDVELVRSPEGWVPAFSTYRPADMLQETMSSDEGDGIRFIANFGGLRNDDAFVHVFFYPATATEAGVRRTLDSYLATRQERITEARRYRWTLIERPFMGSSSRAGRTYGWIGAGQHADRWFHIAIEYPQEYGDGFGPRADYILQEWIWEEDQSRLIEPANSTTVR